MAVGVGSLLLLSDITDAALPKLRLRLPHDCQFVFTDTTGQGLAIDDRRFTIDDCGGAARPAAFCPFSLEWSNPRKTTAYLQFSFAWGDYSQAERSR